VEQTRVSAADGVALDRWLVDVRTLHERAKRLLAVETVHDLRVAIRRCRAVAQGLKEIDDDAGRAQWRALNDAGRPLFQGLGALRDAQVMRDHARTLLAGDPALERVVALLEGRVREGRVLAKAAVGAFDPAEFARVEKPLPARAERILSDGPLVMHLALRRYEEGRLLHVGAMRSKSTLALHELRIGVKRLRYTVESFLPGVHAAVGKALKKAQDALGELHDFDVLLDWLSTDAPLHSEDRHRVCSPVRGAREEQLGLYHGFATGPDALWPRIRGALAQGRAVVDAHRAFFFVRTGAGLPQLALARASDALVRALAKDVRGLKDARVPALLGYACAAALQKKARRFVRELPNAVDLGERERAMLSLIVRAANGRAPQDHELGALGVRDASVVRALSAVLCVASVLPGRVRVRSGREVVALLVPTQPDPRTFAERRIPLELLLKRPLWLEVRA
jgi:CHAD domain-containing protein